MEEAARPDRTKFFFAMIEQASGAYVGEIGFTREGEGAVELGYFILERFWGQGLVTEAARRVVRFTFEEAGVSRIRIGCYRANAGSERIMVKLGAVKVSEYEGEPYQADEPSTRVAYLLTASGRPA